MAAAAVVILMAAHMSCCADRIYWKGEQANSVTQFSAWDPVPCQGVRVLWTR